MTRPLATAALLLVTTSTASAQAPRRLNLEVSNIDNASSCAFASFRPQLRITNWGTEAVPLSSLDVRLFFNNNLAQPIEFVGADFVRIFSPGGGLTGQFATASHFDSAPPAASCLVAPDRRANQTHHIAFSPVDPTAGASLPPNGGFATVVVAFRRAGGLAPFDAGCDDFSKLLADPTRAFHNDRFFNLVEQNPMGPPHTLICEFLGPNTRDPDSGIDAGVEACGTNACGGQ
jgi:hypothetical protein